MFDPASLFAVLAVFLLAYSILSGQRHRRGLDRLRAEMDAVEGQNRKLHDEKTGLSVRLAEATGELGNLRERMRLLEGEKAELERRRDFLEQAAARLEKARAALDSQLTALQGEHTSLRTRVVSFQGDWDHHLSTVEEEISTLMRQLGEFRKGTRLPIPNGES
jgi:chromosome segregation ATPase